MILGGHLEGWLHLSIASKVPLLTVWNAGLPTKNQDDFVPALVLNRNRKTMTVISLPNSKWKWHLKTAISSFREKVCSAEWSTYRCIASRDIKRFSRCRRSATQYHLQKTSAKWSLLELALRKTSEGPGCLEMQCLRVSRKKGYGFYESTSLN